MAMIPKEWSLSALAVELGMDRRSLAKKLADLAPCKSAQVGARMEKRWLLADVIAHLSRTKVEIDSEAQRLAAFHQAMQKFMRTEVFPKLIDSDHFRTIALAAHNDYGLGKEDALDLLLETVLCIGLAIDAGLGTRGEDFDFGDSLVWRWGTAKCTGQTTQFIASNWPPCSIPGEPRTQ